MDPFRQPPKFRVEDRRSKRDLALSQAREALGRQQPVEAAEALKPLLSGSHPDPEALFLAGLMAESRGAFAQARQYAERAYRLEPGPDVTLLLARCHRRAGQTDACVRLCDRVMQDKGPLPRAMVIKGGALEEAGRYDEAETIVETLMISGQKSREARELAARVDVQRKRYDTAIGTIHEILDEGMAHDESLRTLLYLLAKAQDRAGRYPEAFDAAARANAIGELPFDASLYADQVDRLIGVWSADRIGRFPLSACRSEVPVFIAGMPRSGTSLIDQIIDAHPQAAGVGELNSLELFAHKLSSSYDPTLEPPGCFGKFGAQRWTQAASNYDREIQRQAAPGVRRIVNKALGNNKLVGMLARLFPRTRIIHALRDPRDVAVSCFMGGFNNRMHPWTTRIEWALAAWEQSRRMMEHWKRTLDVPILEVRYERLVTDPGTEFPRIVEFLGLPWDESCREFHRSRRTVRTLSYDQVNRPLYTSSAGRNQHYAFAFDGMTCPAYDPDR